MAVSVYHRHLLADTYGVELKYNGSIISQFRAKEFRHGEIKDPRLLSVFCCPAYIAQLLIFHHRIASYSA